VNGGIGAVGSVYHLLEAHRNFEERSTTTPAGSRARDSRTLARPLARDVDLVLLDFSANDIEKRAAEYAASTEARAACGVAALASRRDSHRSRFQPRPPLSPCDRDCLRWWVDASARHSDSSRAAMSLTPPDKTKQTKMEGAAAVPPRPRHSRRPRRARRRRGADRRARRPPAARARPRPLEGI